MIFHIFSIPFLPWVFHRRLFKVLRKKNEIHCTSSFRSGPTSVRQVALPQNANDHVTHSSDTKLIMTVRF